MSELWQLAIILMTIFILAQAVAILAVARAVGVLQLRLPERPALQTSDGLAVGAEAPDLVGYELRHRALATVSLRKGRWAVVFLTPSCSVCRTVVRQASFVGKAQPWGAGIVFVARGQHDQNRVLRQLAPHLVMFSDPNGDLHGAYGVEQVPYAFVVVDGRILAKGIVNNREQIELLLEGESMRIDEPMWVPVDPSVAAAESQPGGR